MSGFANYFRAAADRGRATWRFPRPETRLSFWLFIFGGVVFYASLFWEPTAGRAGTSYPPLSSSAYLPDGGIDSWIYLIHLTGLSSILGAIKPVRDDPQHAARRAWAGRGCRCSAGRS